MTRIILYIDSKPAAPELAGALSGALSTTDGAELVQQLVEPGALHTAIEDAFASPELLGIIAGSSYRKALVGYCSELSREAYATGAVSAIVRRQRGGLYGHNSEPSAFAACLTQQKVKRVRSALVLGAGMAARIALAGLRELNCSRFMVGFRNQRRIAELSGLFRDIRRQLSYFPLSEMKQFFEWAERSGLFLEGRPMPPPDDEFPPDDGGKDSLKRWDLLVNATPLGEDSEDEELVSSLNFMRCFNRVFDMVPVAQPSGLVISARDAGVPVIEGSELARQQTQQALAFWQRELKKLSGSEAPAGDAPPSRRMEIRRK